MKISKYFTLMLVSMFILFSCEKKVEENFTTELVPTKSDFSLEKLSSDICSMLLYDIDIAMEQLIKEYDLEEMNIKDEIGNVRGQIEREQFTFANLAYSSGEDRMLKDEKELLKNLDILLMKPISLEEMKKRIVRIKLDEQQTYSKIEEDYINLIDMLDYAINTECMVNQNRDMNWECAVGLLVAIGGGASGNPLAIIAGGVLIQNNC